MSNFNFSKRYRRAPRSWAIHPLFIAWMIFCLAMGIYSFVSSKRWAQDQLVRSGYTKVEMTGYQFIALPCNHYSTAHGFTAVKNGSPRQGLVCTNIFYSYVVEQ